MAFEYDYLTPSQFQPSVGKLSPRLLRPLTSTITPRRGSVPAVLKEKQRKDLLEKSIGKLLCNFYSLCQLSII